MTKDDRARRSVTFLLMEARGASGGGPQCNTRCNKGHHFTQPGRPGDLGYIRKPCFMGRNLHPHFPKFYYLKVKLQAGQRQNGLSSVSSVSTPAPFLPVWTSVVFYCLQSPRLLKPWGYLSWWPQHELSSSYHPPR